MAQESLEGMRVAVIATDGFEESELLEPRKALDDLRAETVVVAPEAGELQGMKHDEKGETVDVDLTLDRANPDEFDAVLLPGGALNADALRVEPRAQEFVRKMDRAGKPMAVICHAPWLLVSAGLVKGRTLTAYHTIQDDIRNAGGKWVDREVVPDRNWVTSRQPSDIPAFNSEMIRLFSSQKANARSAAPIRA
jgi:protease I